MEKHCEVRPLTTTNQYFRLIVFHHSCGVVVTKNYSKALCNDSYTENSKGFTALDTIAEIDNIYC